jgi:hypothetical protein
MLVTQCERNKYLVLIKFTILVFLFTFILESNNDKTYKNVNHEESNDDDINYVVSSNNGTKIMDGAFIFIM